MRASLIASTVLSTAAAVSVYVSAETGSDSNPGTDVSSPLQSINAALVAAQTHKASEIYLAGSFFVNETQKLTQAHSGLRVEQWPGRAPAVLSGGEIIPAASWSQSNGVWSAPLSETAEQALQKRGNGRIFVNGVAKEIVRTKTMRWETALGDQGFVVPATDLDPSWSLSKESVSQWRVAAFHSWTKAYHSVADVNAANHSIHFGERASFLYENYTYCSKMRYYIEGIPELPLTPGHWRMQPATASVAAQLHYAPAQGEQFPAKVNVPVVDSILAVQNAKSITLKSIVLEHSTSGDCSDPTGFSACDRDDALMAPGALLAQSSPDLKIEDVQVRHSGGMGILATRCSDLVIQRVGIVSSGAIGIRVVSSPKALINNTIVKGYGARFPGADGINMANSQNATVSHSDICCGLYAGISGGGESDSAAFSTYAFNHVHDIGSEGDDGVCDFAGYHGSNRFSKHPIFVTSNIFRNVTAYANGGGGIYMDVSSAGYQVSRNLVHDVAASPIIWNINPGVKPAEDAVPTRFENNVLIANKDNEYSRIKANSSRFFWGAGNPVLEWTGHTASEMKRNVIVADVSKSPSRGEWFNGRPCAKDNPEAEGCSWSYEDNFKLLESGRNVWYNASSHGRGAATFPGGCNVSGDVWKGCGADCVCRDWDAWKKQGQEKDSLFIDPKLTGPLLLVTEPKALALGIEPLTELSRAGADWTLSDQDRAQVTDLVLV